MEGRGRRQVEKQRAREQRDQVEASKKDYRKIWLEIKEFEFPIRPEDREQFFLSEISKGEQLINQGTFLSFLILEYGGNSQVRRSIWPLQDTSIERSRCIPIRPSCLISTRRPFLMYVL